MAISKSMMQADFPRALAVLLLGGGLALAAPAAAAEADATSDTTVAGEFSVERPTLKSAGFDWWIEGDDNRNASVSLQYRKVGEARWRDGMPLLRLQHEDVNAAAINSYPPANGHPDNGTVMARPPLYYQVPNMFSGSILGLEPGTEYEARLSLRDPDGVSGSAVREARFRTRAEPAPFKGGKVYHVYPWDYQGPRQQPAFTGLLAAYYMEARHADWSNASPPRVQPGDTIVVHAGVYKDNRNYYGYGAPDSARLATTFDGTYHLVADGTPDRPIAIVAAGDGEVIFDGADNAVLFDLMGADYHYFEGITVRNTDTAFLVGRKGVAGASGFTLRNSKIEQVGRGVHAEWSGSKDFYIADNVFTGRHSPDKMMGWGGRWAVFPDYPEAINGPMGSEFAVKIYGQGHVVAHNRVRNWHDGIDVATYGDPDGSPKGIEERLPVSIDIYNNDISKMGDNCIEADGGARNIRVFGNRCMNSSAGGFSAQTIFGGPAYFIRNVLYSGVGGSLKLSISPTGVVAYNNTFIAEENSIGLGSNLLLRNNIFVAHNPGEAPAFGVSTLTSYSSSDHNGFNWPAGLASPLAWNAPPAGQRARYDVPPDPARYASLAAMAAQAGQERPGKRLGMDVFVNVPLPDASDIRKVYSPAGLDFRLRPRSAAVDAGTVIPNVTDGYSGRAPDLGAIELGQEPPDYGPRQK